MFAADYNEPLIVAVAVGMSVYTLTHAAQSQMAQ